MSEELDLSAWRIVRLDDAALREHAVLRVRLTKPARADIGTLTTAIVIKWPYASASGLPDEADNQRQMAFERALDSLASENDNSELVQVATGGSLKEWIFYARHYDLFMERFNALLHEHERYPISIESYTDAGWAIWKDLLDDLRAKGVV